MKKEVIQKRKISFTKKTVLHLSLLHEKQAFGGAKTTAETGCNPQKPSETCNSCVSMDSCRISFSFIICY
jgi:hypothetical protein